MELLRIIAMMMVIMLHYLGKGGLLPALTGPLLGNGYIAWILETLSIVAVNVYMLISGFFLSGSGFKTGRLFQLLCQVLFYSIGIPLVCIACGILQPEEVTLYQLLQYVLPAQMEHYWFATAYVIMYVFSPILGTAVKQMKKGQLKAVILILLVFWSVSKSVLPVRLEIDRLGYDGLWFMCVYLIAAYMRLYGIALFQNRKKSLCLYLAGCGAIFLVTMGSRELYLVTGKFEDFLGAAYHYNHILNVFAAMALFYAFYHWNIPEEGLVARLIVKTAPYTFGVYLLHEHLELRYLWPQWLNASGEGNPLVFVLRSLGAVLVVFVAGVVVDMVRGMLFGAVAKWFAGSRPAAWLKGLDEKIAGR